MRIHEKHVKEEAVADLPTQYGDFRLHGYVNDITGEHHLALVKGDIGDGEDVLSKHPVRAASLQNIWARYADDLDDRIESRIRSITGDNGNSCMYKSIQEFLTVQYPNLLAVMLYYKQIFYLIKLYTDKYPITKESSDELKKQQEEHETLYTYAQLLNILNNSKNN